MSAAYAKANGFAIAERALSGWHMHCPTCRETHPLGMGTYKGEASKIARTHNAERHD